MPVTHNPAASRYETTVDGALAVADYRMAGQMMTITHVGVPKQLEGRGIASELVKTALDDARARGLKVKPLCPFASAYIKRHPEYSGLVA